MGNCTPNSRSADPVRERKGMSTLTIECSSWNRDSHGLYDYECKEPAMHSFTTAGTVALTRDEQNDIQVRERDKDEEPSTNA